MLKADNVHKSYHHLKRQLYVLRGIDLEIKEGDVISIVGPSGAGKSTLLHILGGLDKPSDGKVYLDNEEIYSLHDKKRAELRNKKVGFVFQFYHLLPEFTALENVILPALVKGETNSGPVRDKGLSLLDEVGLKQRVNHKPNELSGGEQQRVAIARALINVPKIIFCDEPTGNLDSKAGEDIINLLMRLNKENHQTIVMVTHDHQIAKRTKIKYQMRDGQLLN